MQHVLGSWFPRSLSEWSQLRDWYVTLRAHIFYQGMTSSSGIDGEFELVFGTSASSPVVGPIFTLVNDARIAIGKRPVGWLNPLVCGITPLFRLSSKIT